MLPFVPTGIGEFQTLAHLFQTDTASTLVGFVLGVITVGYFATHAIGAFAKIDTDIAGFGRRDSMLEGILYERDEYHRGDLRWSVGANVETCFNGHIGRESYAHQCNVVSDEIYLFGQRHEILLVVVENMAQQAAQFLYCLSLIHI